MCPPRQEADCGSGSCQLCLEESGAGHGCLAADRASVATNQGCLVAHYTGRRTEYAGEGENGVGRNLGPVGRRRFRQKQTVAAATGNAELLGSDARSTGSIAISQRNHGGSGAAGGATPEAGPLKRRKP